MNTKIKTNKLQRKRLQVNIKSCEKHKFLERISFYMKSIFEYLKYYTEKLNIYYT